MCLRGVSREILRTYGVPKGNRSQSQESKGNPRHVTPRNTKEVQRLVGRVTALSWFISQATNKCCPFFHLLKKTFCWDEECDKTFQEFKEHLSYLPLINQPKQGEVLYIYLLVSETTISSVLVREEVKCQYTTLTEPLGGVREVPEGGKDGFFTSCHRSRAKALLSGPCHPGPNRSATQNNTAQARDLRKASQVVDRVKKIWNRVSPSGGYQRSSYCRLHRRVHLCIRHRQGGLYSWMVPPPITQSREESS